MPPQQCNTAARANVNHAINFGKHQRRAHNTGISRAAKLYSYSYLQCAFLPRAVKKKNYDDDEEEEEDYEVIRDERNIYQSLSLSFSRARWEKKYQSYYASERGA